MMTSSNGNMRHWPFVRGIHRSPVNSSHKGQWHGALMFSLIGVWINGWVNNREAGDLRRYLAHYDVIVMCKQFVSERFPLGYPNQHWKHSEQYDYIKRHESTGIAITHTKRNRTRVHYMITWELTTFVTRTLATHFVLCVVNWCKLATVHNGTSSHYWRYVPLDGKLIQ